MPPVPGELVTGAGGEVGCPVFGEALGETVGEMLGEIVTGRLGETVGETVGDWVAGTVGTAGARYFVSALIARQFFRAGSLSSLTHLLLPVPPST